MRRILLAAISLFMLGACSDSCANNVVERLASPNGRYEAVLFQRDCGATTGFSTQISILEAGETVSGGGNVFRADDDHGAAKVGTWGGSWADMKWLAADHLHIRYASKSRLFEQDESVAGVMVSYEIVGR